MLIVFVRRRCSFVVGCVVLVCVAVHGVLWLSVVVFAGCCCLLLFVAVCRVGCRWLVFVVGRNLLCSVLCVVVCWCMLWCVAVCWCLFLIAACRCR